MQTFWRYVRIQAFVFVCGIVGPIFLAVLPTWPYSNGWGYYPSGGLGLILLIILLALVFGKGSGSPKL